MHDTTRTGIAVIESKWNGEGLQMRKNASVRPMFDMLCDLHFGNTHEYVYEMAATSSALADFIKRMAWSTDISTIYFACHGSEKGLLLHGWKKEVITRAKLGKMLLEGSTRRNLKGIYLGACEFGTEALARDLLKNDGNLVWVAGYREEADFINGTALDVIFFNFWLNKLNDDPNIRTRELIESVAKKLKANCQGLIASSSEDDDDNAAGMGLSIFVRARGPKGGIVDLLSDVD
jgi:hypothetical protein